MLQIRNENGFVYNQVEEVAVCYDALGTLHKIGSIDKIETYYNETRQKYILHGYINEAHDLRFTILPKNQELIDKVFQITGYILRLENELLN